MYRYVCEQLPGTNSTPIVTKLCQSYPWPQGRGDDILEVQDQRSRLVGTLGGMRSTEPF